MTGQFNLLNQTLVTPISSASDAAQKLLKITTPDNSCDVISIAEAFGLGISADIKAKSEAVELAQMQQAETAEKEAAEELAAA